MANAGIAPLDPATPVGRLRSTVGDTDHTLLSEGLGEYAVFSDADLIGYLAEAGGGVLRAASIATARLALEYSALGRSIRTEDQQLDIRGRGKDLLEVSKHFSDLAAAEEALVSGEGSFDVVPLAERDYCVY